MEHEMKKRRRGNDEEEEELKNDYSKKRELIGFDSDYDFKFSDSSFQTLGVFDFPWLTEEKQPINELPEELKFDDVFSSSLIETSSETSLTDFSGSDESCRTPFLLEETTTATTTTTLGGGGGGGNNHQLEEEEDEFYDRTSDSRVNDDEINGGDCIWSSVLNQPLFTRSSGKLCHVTDA